MFSIYIALLLISVFVGIIMFVVAFFNDSKKEIRVALAGLLIFGFVLLGVYSSFKLQNGGVASLKIDVVYKTVAYFVPVDGETVIKLIPDGWEATKYYYRVNCKQLRDGCPEKWPENFKVVKDGKKLVLIELLNH